MNDLTLSPPTHATATAGPDDFAIAQTEPETLREIADREYRESKARFQEPPVAEAEIRAEIPGTDEPVASNVVEATDACLQADPELALPETGPKPPLVFTPEALAAAGVVFQATEQTKFVEINAGAQAALIALAPGYGPNEIVGAVLVAYGIEGQVQTNTHPATQTLSLWQSASPKGDAALEPAANNSPSGVDSIIEERGKVYGDPELSHENIGLNWTGMIQQHYQLRLDHPLPAWLVELMMAGFKIHRSARVFHEDNYNDLEAYGLKFAREHQRAAFAAKVGA